MSEQDHIIELFRDQFDRLHDGQKEILTTMREHRQDLKDHIDKDELQFKELTTHVSDIRSEVRFWKRVAGWGVGILTFLTGLFSWKG